MRKIFIVVLHVVGFVEMKAQITPYSGAHIQYNELNKFVGTWQWTSGADTLVIKLYKQEIYMKPPANFFFEEIVGWHKYVKNGIIQETFLQYAGLPFDIGHATILGGPKSENELYGSFQDITNNKLCDLYLIMINNNQTELKWQLRNSMGIKPQGYQWSFSLPIDLTLIRQ